MKSRILTISMVFSLALMLIVTSLLSQVLYAAGPIIVTTNSDVSVAGDGECSLREAIENANAGIDLTDDDCISGSGGQDTISLDVPGPYTLSSEQLGILSNIILNANDETIVGGGGNDFRVFLVGDGGTLYLNDAVIRDGVESGGCAVFACSGGGIQVKALGALYVNDTTFTNNTADFGGAIATLGGPVILNNTDFTYNLAFDDGGAIYIDSGDVEMTSGWVYSNTTLADGGGVYINKINASLTTNNTVFEKNEALEANRKGGGIYVKSGTLSLTGGKVISNKANSNGGGIYSERSNDATLTSVNVSYNIAGAGAGLFLGEGSDGAMDISHSTIAYNTASGDGAGIRAMPNTVLTITSSTIHHNNTDGISNAGGGLAASGTTFITDTTIMSNIATTNGGTGGGGGVSNSGKMTMVNSFVTNNVSNQPGGGISTLVNTTLWLDNVLVNQNTAQGSNGNGGGISAAGQTTIRNSTIRDNETTGSFGNGGGVSLSGNTSVMTVTQTLIEHNETNNNGGGLYAVSFAKYVVLSSTVNFNSANNEGGGAYIHNGSSLNIEASTISRNFALDGGGIMNAGGSGTPTVTLLNVTISTNEASDNGGGLANVGLNATTTLTHTTISDNFAYADGGGIYNNNGVVNINNTIVANHSGSGGDCHNFGLSFTFNSNGHNLDSDGTCINNGVNNDITSFDSGLNALADNGGGTETHELLSSSPAFDTAEDGACPTFDQRGISRPQGIACDRGAFETTNLDPVQASSPFIVNTDDDVDDGLCTVSHCSFREAIIAAIAAFSGEGNETIAFDIPGTGPHTITPLSPLPAISASLSIEGLSQTGASCDSWPPTLMIELDGSQAGSTASGLILSGFGSTVQGLVINRFAQHGIDLSSANFTFIECNFIGTDVGGLLDLGNGGAGVHLLTSPQNGIAENRIAYNGADGITVESGDGNEIRANEIYGNGLLGIDLDNDGPTGNDAGDSDTGANNLQNYPIVISAEPGTSTTTINGQLDSNPNTEYDLDFFANDSCDPSGFGEGQTFLGSIPVTTDVTGGAYFSGTLSTATTTNAFITAIATDEDGNSSEFSPCIVASAANYTWSTALPLTLTSLVDATSNGATIEQFLDLPGQPRWYKFAIQPNSELTIKLRNLPANYDVTLYKDIPATQETLNSPQDLVELSAQFAPSAFAPSAFAPSAFAPSAFAPSAFAPSAFAPSAFAPSAFAPSAFAPSAFASAQIQSLIGFSTLNGTTNEEIRINTWNNTGEFYVRVLGRNGAFSLVNPFKLEVVLQSEHCNGVSPINTPISTVANAGGFKTLILTDLDRMVGSSAEKAALQARLADLVARPEVAGTIIDVSADAKVSAANLQADANPGCPFAKNLVAQSIKDIVDAYWEINPLDYIVIVGNDETIPFFRYPDQTSLGNENTYIPPVLDDTASQASLRLGFVLGQDGYGSKVDLSLLTNAFPIPELAIGRLVETPNDAITVLDAYLSTSNGIAPTPTSAFVSGYDFLEDAALAVQNELQAGLGNPIETLIMDADLSPTDPAAWTADDLRAGFLSQRHDISFLAGHFSANNALAADYNSVLLSTELISAPIDLANAIIFSAGCHSGYNIVNDHNVPFVTQEPDWAQAFAQKGAALIAGTGYQYGDTDFIEYGERLYLEFSKQLRTGSGPVSIGQALVAAKQTYLAQIPDTQGLHEKTLLQSTIFGLPMLRVDMPGDRLTPTTNPSIVASVNSFANNPGALLSLRYSDINLSPTLTPQTMTLRDEDTPSLTFTASYLAGKDGTVTNAGEPTLPLEIYNVTVPGTVLRGVGFRGATYVDTLNILPLVGIPTTEIRGVHGFFRSNVFYPITPWDINYFSALAGDGSGTTQLFVTPAQHRSSSITSQENDRRQFNNLDLRLYYSSNTATFAGSGNTPAQASAPSISNITAKPDGFGNLVFSARVVGDPAAGIQEVWVTYTALTSPFFGQWQPLDLSQNAADSTLWTGVLPLSGTDPKDIRYMIQAANGVGLVGLFTNLGEYYTPGIDPGAPNENQQTTNITFDSPPSSGPYASNATFSALLTSNDEPVPNVLVSFKLGSQNVQAVTDSNGRATANITLLNNPDDYTVQAYFVGTPNFASSSTETPFTITAQETTIMLDVPTGAIPSGGSAGIVATLTDATGKPLNEQSIIFIIEGSNGTYNVSIITDFLGRAFLNNIPLSAGSYTLNAYFGGTIPGQALSFSDSRYNPTTASASLNIASVDTTVLYLSFHSNGNIDGLAFRDEDIVIQNLETGAWTMFLDGSDVGLANNDINAFTILDDTSILMSFVKRQHISGLGWVDDSDIVRFIPAQFGSTTVGTFELYFDGSDVDLTKLGEDIDAISFAPDGRLVISTLGSFKVAGGLTGKDEDMLAFDPTSLGETTAGTWESYFDGSDVDLSAGSEDIWGTSIDPESNILYLTTIGNFVIDGLTGSANDIFTCTLGSLGEDTACSFNLFWDGSDPELKAEKVDGLFVGDEIAIVMRTAQIVEAVEDVDDGLETNEDNSLDDVADMDSDLDMEDDPILIIRLPLIHR